jgi:hypothetical protein
MIVSVPDGPDYRDVFELATIQGFEVAPSPIDCVILFGAAGHDIAIVG